MTRKDRLEHLIDLHYPKAGRSAHAVAYAYGWACAWTDRGAGRDVCPYSNRYDPNPNVGGFFVEQYIHWNRGYDACLRWKPLIEAESNHDSTPGWLIGKDQLEG